MAISLQWQNNSKFYKLYDTLGAENFAGRKFCDFHAFLAFFVKVSAKALSKFKIGESFCSQNYKKFSTRKYVFFSNIPGMLNYD